MLTVENPNKFDWANMPLVDCCEGNAYDSYFTLKLFYLIEEKLTELGVMDFVEKTLMPALEPFADIEYNGLSVSEGKLKQLGKILSEKNMNQEDDLYSFPGVTNTDNLSSNNDLIDILYTRDGGFAFYPPDKTSKGSPSVSAPTLKILLEQINKELTKRNE